MSRRAPLIPARAAPRADAPAPPAAHSPIPAFADPRLRHARSDVLRAALARQAHSLVGNHAVANVLARAAPVTTPATKHLTGEEVDAMFAASPFFSTYVKPKAGDGRLVAGHVYHHPHDEFLKRCIAYMKGKQNPETKQMYTDEEAKAYAEGVNGAVRVRVQTGPGGRLGARGRRVLQRRGDPAREQARRPRSRGTASATSTRG